MNTIAIKKYPQLRAICWQLHDDVELTPKEALNRYERNWRHVDKTKIPHFEQEFLDLLIQTVGKGVFLV